MATDEQKQISSMLHSEAKEIIDILSLKSIVSEFGSIRFTGSYALDLMVWNDIDCQITFQENLNPEKSFMKVVGTIFESNHISNIKLINFIKNRQAGMPEGLYCGIKYRYQNTEWKIDIWHLPKNEQENSDIFTNKVKRLLSEERKEKILEWKFKLLGDKCRIEHLASYFLYQAILFENLNSDDDITEYLRKHGMRNI